MSVWWLDLSYGGLTQHFVSYLETGLRTCSRSSLRISKGSRIRSLYQAGGVVSTSSQFSCPPRLTTALAIITQNLRRLWNSYVPDVIQFVDASYVKDPNSRRVTVLPVHRSARWGEKDRHGELHSSALIFITDAYSPTPLYLVLVYEHPFEAYTPGRK